MSFNCRRSVNSAFRVARRPTSSDRDGVSALARTLFSRHAFLRSRQLASRASSSHRNDGSPSSHSLATFSQAVSSSPRGGVRACRRLAGHLLGRPRVSGLRFPRVYLTSAAPKRLPTLKATAISLSRPATTTSSRVPLSAAWNCTLRTPALLATQGPRLVAYIINSGL